MAGASVRFVRNFGAVANDGSWPSETVALQISRP